MRLMLTSAGLETPAIQDCFMQLAGKNMAEMKALFIPTAAINPDAIAVLPKCMNDLLKCGIPAGNITVYDLHKGMSLEELRRYDAVYICGGETRYLLRRMNETGFARSLTEYASEGGLTLGVSAGSLIFANNLPENLGLLPAQLHVHCTDGDEPGMLSSPLSSCIRLTNTRSLIIRGQNDMQIIGR